jgi:hypothetical protein
MLAVLNDVAAALRPDGLQPEPPAVTASGWGYSGENLLTNPGFEQGTLGWTPRARK